RIAFSCSEENLHDEGDLVPEKQTYHNSSYFDEIYHARTAWEHLHDVWPYELSHPPLGKELLSLGILLFGMTPFGWRFSGTLTGVLMLPVMYIFLKRLFGGRRIPLLGTVLLASGFLHYTQTRIATIDSFSVLFILLMYCFMYGWLSDDSPADLALCGFSFGLGIACKWICFYAGAGLALLWIGHWVRAFVLAAREKRPLPVAAFLRNVPFCLFFFILIPGLIYYLSYLPYGRVKGFPVFSEPYTRLVLENQTFMFDYHARLVAQHPYASRWYQWILNIRPILYYLEYLPDGRHIDIAAFNNPLICWGGLMSLAVLLWEAVTRRDRTAAFLLTAYLAELVPWVFITRLTFAYHYFAASVFLVPALCYLFWIMEKASPRRKYVTLAFTAVSVFLFLFFFPVLCGLPVDNGKSKLVFSWLPTWPI
ncbi:MAG: glycosyltransferase family 39 protein, partial [Oscillospiraceae bacterium]|nr:glycosyltransferase family 39 protein [Oscillospiraceae bacterium]